MRFTGDRPVPAPTGSVWEALHDTDVLRAIVPGCREMSPLSAGTYAATMSARVGPIADTYRGTFDLLDLRHGRELLVAVAASGRCGRIAVDLRVGLTEGTHEGTTVLRYVADASVSGFVSRLGTPTLTVAGGHFTGSFFRGLERSVRRFVPTGIGVVA
jgi:carbon monoxide dehydrogenase subunit G